MREKALGGTKFFTKVVKLEARILNASKLEARKPTTPLV